MFFEGGFENFLRYVINQPFKGRPIVYWAYHKESFSILNLIEETFHRLHVDFQNFVSFRLFVD